MRSFSDSCVWSFTGRRKTYELAEKLYRNLVYTADCQINYLYGGSNPELPTLWNVVTAKLVHNVDANVGVRSRVELMSYQVILRKT